MYQRPAHTYSMCCLSRCSKVSVHHTTLDRIYRTKEGHYIVVHRNLRIHIQYVVWHIFYTLYHVWLYIYTYVCCVHPIVCGYVFFIRTYIYICIHIYAYIYIHIHIYIYMYIYVYIYIHIHMYSYIRVFLF